MYIMNKVLHIIINMFKKYDSLREEAWTHFIVLVTYIFAISIVYHNITTPNDSGTGYTSFVYLIKTVPFYLCFIGLSLSMGFYNIFQKDKIKNKFLTKNKIYTIYWYIGNIIFFYIVRIFIIFIK